MSVHLRNTMEYTRHSETNYFQYQLRRAHSDMKITFKLLRPNRSFWMCFFFFPSSSLVCCLGNRTAKLLVLLVSSGPQKHPCSASPRVFRCPRAHAHTHCLGLFGQMRVWRPLTSSEMQDDPEHLQIGREPKFCFFFFYVPSALQEIWSPLFSADTDPEAAPRRDAILKAMCDFFKAAMYFFRRYIIIHGLRRDFWVIVQALRTYLLKRYVSDVLGFKSQPNKSSRRFGNDVSRTAKKRLELYEAGGQVFRARRGEGGTRTKKRSARRAAGIGWILAWILRLLCFEIGFFVFASPEPENRSSQPVGGGEESGPHAAPSVNSLNLLSGTVQHWWLDLYIYIYIYFLFFWREETPLSVVQYCTKNEEQGLLHLMFSFLV